MAAEPASATASHAASGAGGEPRADRVTTGGAASTRDALSDATAERPSRSRRSERPAAGSSGPAVADDRRDGQRSDIRKNSIEALRVHHTALKQAVKKAKREVRNATRRRSRVLRRLKDLDTESVMAVLMERARAPTPSGRGAALTARGAGDSAPEAGEPAGAPSGPRAPPLEEEPAALSETGPHVERPADDEDREDDASTLGRPSPEADNGGADADAEDAEIGEGAS